MELGSHPAADRQGYCRNKRVAASYIGFQHEGESAI